MKKLLAVLLTVVMLLGVLPIGAMAEDASVYPEEIEVYADENLSGVTYAYNQEEGLVTVNIAENNVSNWQKAYIELGAGASSLAVSISILAPEETVGCYTIAGNNNNVTLEKIKDIVEENYDCFDPCEGSIGNGMEIAHISHNSDGTVTIALVEEDLTIAVAWLNNNGEVTYQIVKVVGKIAENNAGAFKFNDTFANINNVPKERLFVNSESDLMSAAAEETGLDYVDGILTLTYVGTKTDYNSVKDDFISAGFDENNFGGASITVTAPEGYVDYYSQENEACESYAVYFDGEILSGNEYYFYWVNANDSNDIIVEKLAVEFKFPFKNIWMERYWEALDYGTADSRLKFTVGTSHKTAVEYSLEELAEAGVKITFDEGYIHVGYEGAPDAYVVANVIVQIDAPEGAVAYKRINGGGDLGNYEFADEANMSITSSETKLRTIENDGKPRMDLSGMEAFEIEGISVWVGLISGSTRTQIIDWYDANGNVMQRDYYYAYNDDVSIEETAEAEENISSKVEKVTPIGEDWFLTCNHYPQSGRNDAYYFELEAGGDVPEEEKTIYIPYSYLDENLTYAKAVKMGLKPKLHHYDDGHTQIELLKGELTEYGIKFVVEHFSPFVIAYDIEEVKEEIKDTVVVEIGAYKPEREEEQNPGTGAPIC